MGRSKFYLVSEDYNTIQQYRDFCQSRGVELEVYTQSEWDSKWGGSSLSTGANVVAEGTNVIPFPGMNKAAGKVQTINELESVAIEKAIYEFNGNLTEAAKALGIGRATLYRKVKQYNINPSLARKKRVAA